MFGNQRPNTWLLFTLQLMKKTKQKKIRHMNNVFKSVVENVSQLAVTDKVIPFLIARGECFRLVCSLCILVFSVRLVTTLSRKRWPGPLDLMSLLYTILCT